MLSAPLNRTVSLFYDSAWQDVSSYVVGDITISRGLRSGNLGGVAEPATCTLPLRNTDGRFTLGNPGSPLFGKIGRNTQLRVQVTTDAGTSTRFVGEVAEWPREPSDGSAQLVTSRITAAGVLRRLQRGRDAGDSPLARYYRAATSLGYWSLEDGPDRANAGTSYGSPTSTSGRPGARMTVTGGKCGDRSDVMIASDPIPTLGTARLQASPARSAWSAATGNAWTMVAHCVIPSAALAATCDLIRVTTSGSAKDWYVQILTDGTVQFVVGDNTGGALLIGGPYATSLAGQTVKLRFATEQSGADVTWALSYLLEGETSGVSLASGTIVSQSNGRPQTIRIGDGDGGDIAIGHIAIIDGNLGVTFGAEAFAGHAGENVAVRVDRLATDAGVTSFETPTTSAVLVGPQRRAALVDLLRDAVACDGVLIDQRTAVALTWRGWHSRVSPTEVALAYGQDLAAAVKPLDDDDRTINDATVSRRDGASGRVEVSTGSLGIPTVGRYSASATLGLHRDADAIQAAAFLTSVGTINEVRIPEIQVDVVKASSATATAVIDGSLDIGSRVVLSGLPTWVGTSSLRQIVEGYTEVIGYGRWLLTLNTTPAAPFDSVVLDDSTMAILAPDGATLSAAITTTSATSMSVATPAGKPLWQTGSGRSIPVLLSGTEEVTVTNITGASSPQTFTITRAVNGVSATHLSAATVELARPRRLAL